MTKFPIQKVVLTHGISGDAFAYNAPEDGAPERIAEFENSAALAIFVNGCSAMSIPVFDEKAGHYLTGTLDQLDDA